MKLALNCLILILLAGSALGQNLLPDSVNIVTGVPLTIPEQHMESMGLKAHENTGGWGDVMSNVGMAMEIKKQFPEVVVRLIVTLNDDDTRPYVNKVRNFIPKILKNAAGDAYLNPDQTSVQFYEGLEIYFVKVPNTSMLQSESYLTPEQKAEIQKSVEAVPVADLGIQFSANNSAYSNLVLKAQKMHLYFEEYSEQRKSHAFSFFQGLIPQIKINAGPLGFGVYGFGSKEDARGSELNKNRIQSWLKPLGLGDLGKFDLAFAYAGDAEMIEDYVKAVEQTVASEKKGKTLIVYKGSGDVVVSGNVVKIPLGAHAKELGHALIAESTYSPLVTGDGSLSSALETTGPKKSFLYERVNWKNGVMATFLNVIFRGKADLLEKAFGLLIPQTVDLESEGLTRDGRVNAMRNALANHSLHKHLHQYFSHRQKSLNIADNTMNAYQLNEIFKTLLKGFKRKMMYSEGYLIWLLESTKQFNAREGLPFKKWIAQLDDQVYGKSFQLIEKWFALYSLWEMDQAVDSEMIRRVVAETAEFLKQKNTNAKYSADTILMQMLDQVNASQKSKLALYQALHSDSRAWAQFNELREKYNAQSNRKLLLSRQKTCRQSVTF